MGLKGMGCGKRSWSLDCVVRSVMNMCSLRSHVFIPSFRRNEVAPQKKYLVLGLWRKQEDWVGGEAAAMGLDI